jgi:hypothetical protein
VKVCEKFVVDRRFDAADREQADRAGDIACALVEIGFEPRDVAVNVAGNLINGFAGLGWCEIRAAPFNQLALQCFLEAPQRLAHRRLGHVQPRRGAAQAALLHDHEVRAQEVPVEPVVQKIREVRAHRHAFRGTSPQPKSS